MSIQAGTTYRIVNAKSGTALDVSGSDGRSISGWEAGEGPNQRWELSNDGYRWVFRAQSGQFLAPGGEPNDGTPVVGQGEPFAWDIYPDPEDSSLFKIFYPDSPHVVDLSDHGNSESGTPVKLWYKWEGKNQSWRFEQV